MSDLRTELAQFDDALAQLDSDIAMANALPLPELEPTDPEVMAQAAADPRAAPELRAVAAAVAQGRTTWAEVATTGGALDLPEVQNLYAAGAEHVRHMIEEERDAAAAEAPATQPRVKHDDEYYEDAIDTTLPGWGLERQPRVAAKPVHHDEDDHEEGGTIFR